MDRGPSITSSVISSPRWAGRQCITTASGFAWSSSFVLTWYGRKIFSRSSFSRSWPIETPNVCGLECAVLDASDVTARNARRVRDRLSAAQFQVIRVEEEGVPSELGHSDLERHASPRRRLLEDHREAPPAKRLVWLSGFRPILDAPGEVEQGDEIVADVAHRHEIAFSCHGRRSIRRGVQNVS